MEEEHLVCQQCGTKKGAGNAFCENCGTVVNLGAAFCTSCGAKIEAVINEDKDSFNTNTQYSQQPPAQQFQSQAQKQYDQYLPPKKYCRNCGAAILNSQMICGKCNTKADDGNSFCPHCGSAVQPGAVVCVSCGKSVKKQFDANSYFNEFGDNIADVFKTPDKKNMLIENFASFAAVLIFIIGLLPIIKLSWYEYSESYNTFATNTFAGIFLLLGFAAAVLNFEPHCLKFIKSQPAIDKWYKYIPSALDFIGLIIIFAEFFSGVDAASGLWSIDVGFTFFGFILIFLILASVADSVYLILKENNIIK